MNRQGDIDVAFIVAHDAYLKSALGIAHLIRAEASISDQWFTTSHRLAVQQDITPIDVENSDNLALLSNADIIFAGLGGRETSHLINKLERPRASIIGFFPGILNYRIFEALATRLLCDAVLLNSKRDYHLYSKLAKATIGIDNGVLWGCPWIGLPPPVPGDIDLLFIEQSSVPEAKEQRVALMRNIWQMARLHPDWRIVIAIRSRKGQTTSHELTYCLSEVAEELPNRPANIRLEYGEINLLIARAARIATISSSAAFTSLAWQKPTIFVSDLGFHHKWGNTYFRNSGHVGPLDGDFEKSTRSSQWIAQHVSSPQPGPQVSKILTVKPQHPISHIPGFSITNLRLIKILLLHFGTTIFRSSGEIAALFSTIKNLNKRIFRR